MKRLLLKLPADGDAFQEDDYTGNSRHDRRDFLEKLIAENREY